MEGTADTTFPKDVRYFEILTSLCMWLTLGVHVDTL